MFWYQSSYIIEPMSSYIYSSYEIAAIFCWKTSRYIVAVVGTLSTFNYHISVRNLLTAPWHKSWVQFDSSIFMNNTLPTNLAEWFDSVERDEEDDDPGEEETEGELPHDAARLVYTVGDLNHLPANNIKTISSVWGWCWGCALWMLKAIRSVQWLIPSVMILHLVSRDWTQW